MKINKLKKGMGLAQILGIVVAVVVGAFVFSKINHYVATSDTKASELDSLIPTFTSPANDAAPKK